MALTQKQENFCRAFIETGNASEAYRKAFNTSNMKMESVNQKAYELLKRVDITARVDELRAEAAKRNEITVDDLIAELEEARVIAATGEKPQPAAMVSATMGKAKILGMDKLVIAGDEEKPLLHKVVREIVRTNN